MKILLIALAITLIFCDEYYTVVAGDNLTKIAKKYGTTVTQLCQWTNIKNPNYIQVGQKLIVKKSSGGSNSNTNTQKSGQIVTAEQMKRMGWKNYNLNDLNNCLNKFKINTSARIRHFISQCSHESACGTYTEELGGSNYCSKYEGRKDLGNTHSGDGCRFKGAGYLQMTGRYNYQQFANYMGDNKIMNGVSYVAKNYPWSSAGFWWHNNNMNSFCDQGASVERITRKVNGGTNGLSSRQSYYKKACQIF